MKYNDNGEYKDIYVKAFDTLPVGTQVNFNGTSADIPNGWEQVGTSGNLLIIEKTSQYIEGGATIETGSNENGNWIKYSNGIMQTFQKVNFTNVDITTLWGNLYATTDYSLPNFPQTFTEIFTINKSLTGVNSVGILNSGSVQPSNTNPGSVAFFRGSSGTVSSITVYVETTGRWK